jgi:hypothetical protein
VEESTYASEAQLSAQSQRTVAQMPKFPKAFGRRKSSTNALEEFEEIPLPPQSTFKVFERPDGGSQSFDGGLKLRHGPRPSLAPSQMEDDNMFADLKGSRYVASSTFI